jgi:hypothetical protein
MQDPLNASMAAMAASAGMLVVLDRSGRLFSRAWALWEVGGAWGWRGMRT